MGDRYLITGGAGFIGSNFIRYLLGKYPDCRVVNLDKLTYAGNLENVADVANHPGYNFIHGDICDMETVAAVIKNGVDYVINFAAETHVDRSIMDPSGFIRTDVMGTYVLLEASRRHLVKLFVQISTDEVYGSIAEGSFSEADPVNPSSPYSASKAGAELVVKSFVTTYGFPAVITRASNNYGPYQYPEKLIPYFVTNALEDQPLPLYGDGLNIRDWLFVGDHCRALDVILRKGVPGEIYNIGGDRECTNIEITRKILELLDKPESLIRKVKDRPGHDRRYSIDSSKMHALGWSPDHDFNQGMIETVSWYRENRDWWRRLKIRSSEYYRDWYDKKLGMKP
ncbi:dTDP-glucose 4,6-dehydratase [bacterium]|nr:dTDP-glucose 4,6-dehydratase [candidate division CSSED10-310 bacterium]